MNEWAFFLLLSFVPSGAYKLQTNSMRMESIYNSIGSRSAEVDCCVCEK